MRAGQIHRDGPADDGALLEGASRPREERGPTTAVDFDAVVINEAQLLLAEKRTSLAAMRTGIAVYAIPLSVLGLLIATSRYYDVVHVLHLIVPLALMLAGLLVLGSYLVVRALAHIRRYDRMMLQLKRRHGNIAAFLD